MKPLKFSLLTLAAYAAFSLPPEPVLADGDNQPICEFPPPGKSCPIDRFKMAYVNSSGPPDYCLNQANRHCILRGEYIAPVPSWIHCSSLSATMASCMVWPDGDLHYDWAVSWGLSTANPPSWSGPSQLVYCNNPMGSGNVSVVVTTPDGVSETVFTGITCGTIEP